MNDGDSWWSITAVTPESTASSKARSAEASSDFSSSAASSRHQTFSRISRKERGGSPGPGIPHASAE